MSASRACRRHVHCGIARTRVCVAWRGLRVAGDCACVCRAQCAHRSCSEGFARLSKTRVLRIARDRLPPTDAFRRFRAGDGKVMTWGKNTAGQMGTGTDADQHHPTAVVGLQNERNFTGVACGGLWSRLRVRACVRVCARACDCVTLLDACWVITWTF